MSRTLRNGRPVRIQNSAVVSGSGALGYGDRGAFSTLPFHSGNPYNSQDYVTRWRQYVQMYETSWEARKIIRIIPEDALRKDWEIQGIPEEMVEHASARLERLQFLQTLKKSLMLERLLGGCLTFMGVDGEEDDLDKAFHPNDGKKLHFCNAIPVSRISRVEWCHDPLSEHYMRPESYLINSQVVHVSRMLVWDGDPLFDPFDYALNNFRANLAGFGESKLAPIWDDVVKAVGTRQAAYQLIQTNNAIIMAVNDLADLQGTVPGQKNLEKLKEVANQISLYRAALIDGEKTSITQQAASFGSVPELVMAYLQILSAASDIPATRFIGQAPGGLNATGDSDLENYYNVIDAYQRQRIVPNIRRVYDVINYEKFGDAWHKVRGKMNIKFPPLWNESELEQAQRTGMTIDSVLKLVDAGLCGDKKAIEELNAKELLSVKLDETDISIMDTGFTDVGAAGDMGKPTNAEPTGLQALRNSISYSANELLMGKAGGNPSEFSLSEFSAGMKEEQEHAEEVGGDEVKIAQIVLDHLREDGHYYTKLKKAGLFDNCGDAIEAQKIQNYITESNGKYTVHAESGKHLGEYNTKGEAEKRLRQIEYFKHQKEQLNNITFDTPKRYHIELSSGFADDFNTYDEIRAFVKSRGRKGDEVRIWDTTQRVTTTPHKTVMVENGFENKINLEPLPTPTDSQIISGNYKKHHLKLHGLEVAIENPKDSYRTGIAADGKRWKSKLPAHYGYIKRTEGADGDHVDCYIGPHEESELVFIVDQKDLDTKQFDEHKCIFGVLSTAQAMELYTDGFSDGRGKDRLGKISPVHVSQFKQWVAEGDTTKPYGGE